MGRQTTADGMPVIVRLTGRGANGAERDGGRRTHVLLVEPGAVLRGVWWGAALCGATPGRTSGGFAEVDGPEEPTCPRCRAKADRRIS